MKLLNGILLVCLVVTGPAHSTEADAEGNENVHEQDPLALNAQRRDVLGVEVAPAVQRSLPVEVTAPGEVEVNQYHTAQVTPRIAAQVVSRHVQMGQTVKKDEPLVTLSSVAMAEAQGELLVADREWRRVQKLGRKVVSETRFIGAQVKNQQAHARVLAYGMTLGQVKRLLSQSDASKATGEFALLAPQAGLVYEDDFAIGELIEPGRVLVRLTDESTLWVEAKLDPLLARAVRIDNPVRVRADRDYVFDGRVIQFHHQLDKTSRTLLVRIEVKNPDGGLHPGQFVDVAIDTGQSRPMLVVPQEAVLLLQGGPAVFKFENDDFHPQVVQTGVTHGDWIEITAGLAEGEPVAIKGAFTLKSLMLKSQIGDAD